MDILIVFIGYAFLILLGLFLCFSEFFKIRNLYKKAYNKKLLYKQYLNATKVMQNNKIAEMLYHCDMIQKETKANDKKTK